MPKVRIVKVDDYNYAVLKYQTVKNKKTGEVEREWKPVGYYGDKLEWAIKGALFHSLPKDVPITVALIKKAVKEIKDELDKIRPQ